MENADKVLVVGLDGATFDLIKPWVEEGKLPTLGGLMEEGVHGSLKSVPNMNSGAAWPSFATGKNPGKHGLFWIVQPRPNSYDLEIVNGSFCQAAPIWRILSRADKKVGVINVPMTYPVEEVNGFLLAGFDCPDIDSPGFSFPPNLVEEIIKNCGGYIITSRASAYAQEGMIDKAIRVLHEQVETRVATARYLMKTRPWDFFIVVFMATDIAHHIFWHLHDPSHPAYDPILANKYGDPICDVYRKLDDTLAALLKEAGDDVTVVVMSDHGAALNPGGAGVLNQWLAAEGFLRWVEPRVVERVASVARYAALHAATQTIRFVQHVLGKGMIRTLRRRFPNVRWRLKEKILASAIDWRSTKAYWDGGGSCIRINLAGRERQGIVKPGREYDEVRDAIVERLSQCRDVITGRPVVEKAHKREEIYHGPYVDRAPDLEIVWKSDGVIKGIIPGQQRSRLAAIESSLWRTPGGHSMNGILIMKGKHIRKGVEIDGTEIVDLAPTILYLMGQGIPSDMDGNVLKEAIEHPFLIAHPVHYIEEPLPQGPHEEGGEPYSEEGKKEIEQRLRGLGYIQ